jgi:hypothetical protein
MTCFGPSLACTADAGEASYGRADSCIVNKNKE